VIHDVDKALRTLLEREVSKDVEVLFDAPTKEWAGRRNKPTIDVYLYDIREDLRRREYGITDITNGDGRVVSRRQQPRHFKLSYLVTAWTQRPEDEHRILSSTLQCFLRHDCIPSELLNGSSASQGLPVAVNIALPPPEDRSISDVWSALGGELKPSLDLVITTPIGLDRDVEAAPPVIDEPRLRVSNSEGAVDEAGARPDRSGRDRVAAAGASVPTESAPAKGRRKPRAGGTR
jgi:Pvc16 N-terminal domain